MDYDMLAVALIVIGSAGAGACAALLLRPDRWAEGYDVGRAESESLTAYWSAQTPDEESKALAAMSDQKPTVRRKP